MRKLTILHVNKFHYLRGGSERVYFDTSRLVESHGHKSVFFSMDSPDNIPCQTSEYFVPYIDLNNNSDGLIHKVKTAGRIFYSLEARNRLSKLLDLYSVDIAHLHNIHHQISPSILHELKKRNIPTVITLHDYKMVCASYSMLVNGIPCEACKGKKYFEATKKRCVKGSFAKSLLAALEMYLHHKILDIYGNIDTFISPSMFLKNKLEQLEFKKNIVHLPNFVDLDKFGQPTDSERDGISVVYFGRLSSEKGLWTLLDASNILKQAGKIEVKIIGDGAEREELEEKVKSENIHNVGFYGYMKGEKLYQEIRNSAAVVLTSECYENNPVSVLEAFALGNPVIGSRIGGIPELVKEGKTGYTFEPGNAKDLSEKIGHLLSDDVLRSQMGKNARKLVETEFDRETHYRKLMKIYNSVLEKPNNSKLSKTINADIK